MLNQWHCGWIFPVVYECNDCLIICINAANLMLNPNVPENTYVCLACFKYSKWSLWDLSHFVTNCQINCILNLEIVTKLQNASLLVNWHICDHWLDLNKACMLFWNLPRFQCMHQIRQNYHNDQNFKLQSPWMSRCSTWFYNAKQMVL
jgi:hypothetical protein